MFRRVVPRAVRRAARVLTVSERSKRDLLELYGVREERVVVTPNGVDPAFHPGRHAARRLVRPRRGGDPGAEGPARRARGRERRRASARRRRSREGRVARRRAARRGARVEGYVETDRLAELYRGAACVVQASRYEGFGLPIVEAMASGTPVVAVREAALEEVAGEAAVLVERDGLADGIRPALAERDRLVAAGLERARAFSWRASAERTLAVYRELLA